MRRSASVENNKSLSTAIYQEDCVEEFKLSILLHLALLLFMSVWMLFRGASLDATPKIHRVRLVGPMLTAKPGSGFAPTNIQASSLKNGTSSKLSAGAASVQNSKTTSNKKAVSKKPASLKNKNEKKPAEPGKSIKTKTSKTTNEIENVIQNSTQLDAKRKPLVHRANFDEIGKFSAEKFESAPITAAITGMEMGSPIESQISADDVSGLTEAGTKNDNTDPSGNPKISGETGGGDIAIAGIESLGGGIERFEAPRIIERVVPQYPDWARKQGIRGQAVYKVLIQEAGTVGDVMTLSSTIDPRLAIVGSQALRRWRFTPVLVNGEPQETWVRITVQFTLD